MKKIGYKIYYKLANNLPYKIEHIAKKLKFRQMNKKLCNFCSTFIMLKNSRPKYDKSFNKHFKMLSKMFIVLTLAHFLHTNFVKAIEGSY